MPQIVAVRCKDDSSRDSITVLLSQDAVCLGPDGEPWSGVSLNAELARLLAQRLLHLAKEIECPEQSEDQGAFHSLVRVTSILVLHDGSEHSHRAFSLALDLAARSLASMQLVGIYGFSSDKLGPSSTTEDCLWQKGWLDRLLPMYAQKAAQAGVELRTTMLSATDTHELSGVCNSSRFDLVVLPRRFSGNDAYAFTFRQSLTGATEAGILFCS